VRLLVPDGLPFLEQAVRSRMGNLAAANVLAAREGYACCTRQRTLRTDTAVAAAVSATAPRIPPVFPVSTTDSRAIQTGTWSLERPLLLDGCSACALCALFCPEGAILRDEGGSMVFDLLHCKGCGICALVCPVRDAITMEEVAA
jgi:pyruvate ferredoxin oxidoreductase delta subunit